MKKDKIALILGIMCFILTLAIAIQYRTVKNANKIAGTSVNSELKTEVLKWKEEYEEIYSELEKAEDKLDEVREVATNNSSVSTDLQKRLKVLNSLTGTIDVKGNGVVITIADNKNVTSESISALDNISNYLIHDKDLLILVNELKNAGAEAISINDERIINMSYIAFISDTFIKVNGQRIVAPYIIKAIGNPTYLESALIGNGGPVDNMQKIGHDITIEKPSKVKILKYNGEIKTKYIE